VFSGKQLRRMRGRLAEALTNLDACTRNSKTPDLGHSESETPVLTSVGTWEVGFA
jgi:hypothetical protein